MQAEQTRRNTLPGGERTVIPVLLALSYAFLLPALRAQQRSESAILTQTSAVQPSKQDNQNAPAMKPSRAKLVGAYTHLPLSFEANRGQAPGEVRFLARGQGFTLFLGGDEAVLALKKSEVRSQKSEESCQLSVVSCQSPATAQGQVAKDKEQRTKDAFVRMKLVGADPAAAAAGAEPLPGQVNYFIGNDAAKWRTHIPTYGQVAYRNVYPGVDLVYYGHAGQLEYDFQVNPGASPDAIRMALGGVRQARLNAKGDLALSAPGGEVWLQKPVAYQVDAAGEKSFVDAGFALQGNPSKVEHRTPAIGFRLGSYDRSRALVIDPTLSYSTYLGGAGADSAFGIALDANGNTYVTGQANSTNFPVSSGALQSTNGAAPDAFVTEFNPDGTAVIYSTYLGGSSSDAGSAIAVDSAGAAYVTGDTNSVNFPVTSGVKQPVIGGSVDAFVTKIAPGGTSLVYSTYLGGKQDDYGYAIAVDANGNAFVAGSTASGNDFPLTKNALQPTFGGGTTDAFFTEYNPTATVGGFSTYLGGSGADSATAIALDANGNIYLTGQTSSTNFPMSSTPYQKSLAGGTDAFVTELAAVSTSGTTSLLGSTYLGGSADDTGNGIAVDLTDSIYVAGSTSSSNFPITNTSLQGTSGGGQDAFVTKLTAGAGSLVYSTYLGGAGADAATAVAVDSTGDALVTGNTQSSNFPVTSDALQAACASGITSTGTPAGCDDAFVTSLNPVGASLNYSTFIGGGQHDQGNAIAVDAAGDAYSAGVTESTDFPVTSEVFQDACTTQSATPPCQNAFVVEIGAAAAAVQVAPIVLPFGVQPLNPNPAPSQTVTVTNNSGASLTFSGITATSGTGFAVSSAGTCSTGTPLATGSSCTVVVTFAPTAAGSQTGTLTLSDSATGSPQTVKLSGAGVASVLTVSPTSLAFSGQVPGTESSPQNVTLENFGSAPIAITSISFIGANASDFSQTNTCGSSLGADGSCVISVTFTPAAGGAATATLTVQEGTGNTESVPVSGNGVSGNLSLSAQNLNFGSVVINTKTTSQSVVVTNTGDTAVSITSVSISGTNATSFTLSSKSPCAPSLGVGSTCTIAINFKPLTAGSLSASLSIASSVSGSPQSVALAGLGADFGVASSPTSATVNPGQAATFTVTVAPIGGFNNEVTLSCTGQPTYGACSVSPTTVTPNGSGSVTATVTVTTLAPARLAPPRGRFLPPTAPLGLEKTGLVWLLVGLLGVAVAAAAKRRRSWMLLAATLALALFWIGCSASGNPNNPANNGTPPGSYQVTITGASNGLSHGITVTVTVNT
ncbi:MAG TPA: SBBP repeat-containing protein [Terriglobia bacterium]|nr:SBBP repeat-containing protein [Terriglobia bacterium]